MATLNDKNPLTMHDVRRLAPASLEVMQRHGDKPAIAAYSATMVPAANGVLTALQELDTLKADQVALMATSDAQTAALHGLMLEWSGRLERDLEGFDTGAFVRDADLTFDVVAKAMSLKHFVEQKGAGLPYRETLLTELSARLDGASETAQSANAARLAVQGKQRQVREQSTVFYKELVALRRTVRATLGSSDFDYQRLRIPSRLADEPPTEESEAASTPESDGATRPSSTG